MFDELRRGFARNPVTKEGYSYSLKKVDGEWIVRFYHDGKWMGEGPTYYTDSKDDAIGTAKYQVDQLTRMATPEHAERVRVNERIAALREKNPSKYTPINAPLRVRRAWAHRAHTSRRKNLRKNLNACQGMLQDMVDSLDTSRTPASNPELLVWRNPMRRRKGLGVSGLVVKRRKTSMRRRRRKHRRARNGKITAMLRGRRTGWKGFVKYYGGPKKARKHWRKARKYHGGKSVCGGKRKRRKSRRGRRRR